MVHSTFPADNFLKPCKASNKVVLPDPFAPSRIEIPFCSISRLIGPINLFFNIYLNIWRTQWKHYCNPPRSVFPNQCVAKLTDIAKEISTKPSARANEKSPLDVSRDIAVVSTRVALSILPPTIIIAPTSPIPAQTLLNMR